jgi:hypothetical protein
MAPPAWPPIAWASAWAASAEAVAGSDRISKLPVLEALREYARLVSVRADVDIEDRDAAMLAGRVWSDGRQPPAVGIALPHRTRSRSRARAVP